MTPQQAAKHLSETCPAFPKFGRETLTSDQFWSTRMTDRKTEVAHNILDPFSALLASQNITIEWATSVEPETVTTAPLNIKLMDNDTIGVFFPKDWVQLRERVKQIQGARFARTHWEFTLNLEVCEELPKIAEDYGIELSTEVSQAIERSKKVGLAAVHDSRAHSAELPDWLLRKLGGEPYPFQNVGIIFASHHKRVFINDDQGLGKTIEALGALEAANSYKALLIVPNTMKLAWAAQVKTWLPHRSVSVYMGTRKRPLKIRVNNQQVSIPVNTPYSDVVIINYESIKKHAQTFKCFRWQAVVLDESHYISNGKAKRTQTILELVDHVNPEYRFALTGTPVANKPHELVTQLQFLDRLQEQFGSKSRFLNTWCNISPSKYGGIKFGDADAQTLTRLNAKLRPFQVRRLKADVLPELPPKRRLTLPVELSNRSEYDLAEKNLLVWLHDYVATQKKFLATIAHLSKAEQKERIRQRRADATERAQRNMAFRKIQALRLVAVHGKLQASIEWIKDFLEGTTEKLVVYAIHRDIQDGLLEAFPAATRLHGADSLTIRKQNEYRFQTDPNCRLMIASIPAAAEGITLTAASNMMILELPWTALKTVQTEDRIHRIGQSKSCMIYYIVGTETIDEYLADLIDSKRVVMAAITDGDDAEEEEGIMDSLISRLMD